MQGANPGANPLREVLTRYGTPSTMKVSVPPPVYGPNAQGGYPPPGQGYVAPAQGYPPPGQGDRAPPQGNPQPGQQSYAPTGPGYAPAYPAANQDGGGQNEAAAGADQGGQPVQLQPNAPVQQQSLPPPTR